MPPFRWATGPDGVRVRIDEANVEAHLKKYPERRPLGARLGQFIAASYQINGPPTGVGDLLYSAAIPPGLPYREPALATYVRRDRQDRRYWKTTFPVKATALRRRQKQAGGTIWSARSTAIRNPAPGRSYRNERSAAGTPARSTSECTASPRRDATMPAHRRLNDYSAFVAARMRALQPRGLAEARAAMRQVAAEWRAAHGAGARRANPLPAVQHPRRQGSAHARAGGRPETRTVRYRPARHTRRRNPAGGSSNDLLLLAAVAGGVWWLARRQAGAPAAGPAPGSQPTAPGGVEMISRAEWARRNGTWRPDAYYAADLVPATWPGPTAPAVRQ